MTQYKQNKLSNTLDIIENLTDGIWEWDIENNKSYFSLSWKQKLGYKRDEILDDFN